MFGQLKQVQIVLSPNINNDQASSIVLYHRIQYKFVVHFFSFGIWMLEIPNAFNDIKTKCERDKVDNYSPNGRKHFYARIHHQTHFVYIWWQYLSSFFHFRFLLCHTAFGRSLVIRFFQTLLQNMWTSDGDIGIMSLGSLFYTSPSNQIARKNKWIKIQLEMTCNNISLLHVQCSYMNDNHNTEGGSLCLLNKCFVRMICEWQFNDHIKYAVFKWMGVLSKKIMKICHKKLP